MRLIAAVFGPDTNRVGWSAPAVTPSLIAVVAAAAGGGLVLLLVLFITRRLWRLVTVSNNRANDAAVLQAVLRTCPVGLFLARPDGGVLAANEAFLATAGRTQADLAAGRVQWAHPQPTPPALTGGMDYETRHARPDGTQAPIRVVYRTTERGVGVGFVTDLGEQQQLQRALHDSRTRFQRVVRAAGVGTWDWNIRQDRLQLAPVGLEQQVFDRPVGSITQIADFVAVVQPAYRKRILQAIDEVIRVADMNEYAVAFPTRAVAGTLRWFRTSGRVTDRDDRGRATHLSGVLQEITEQKRIADTLRQLTGSLERRVREEVAAREAAQARAARAERLQALGQLASGIAHDFNNVLQAVASAASLIEHRTDDGDAVARFGRIVSGATARGASITQRLLAFARHDQLRAQPIDPASLLAGLREILAHTLGGSIDVRVELPPAVPPILADYGQLETVLVNLATNARDAMSAGGVLTLSATPWTIAGEPREVPPGCPPAALSTGSYVCLSVADTGCGMDAAILARITEPFFTTKPLGEGTGLGLSMAKAFAEQSGGCLSIVSQPDCGTTVSLWLPQSSEAPAMPVEGDPLMPVEVAAPRSLTPARVLLADDDALVREAMYGVLVDAGFSVVAVAGGVAAVALLDAGETFDILVTDLSMPRLDGLSLIRLFHEQQPRMPAILLTGFSEGSASEAVDVTERGRVSVMRKPVPATQLIARIGKMLAAARQKALGDPLENG